MNATIAIVLILCIAYTLYFGFYLGKKYFYKKEIEEKMEEARQELEKVKKEHIDKLTESAIEISRERDFIEFVFVDYVARQVVENEKTKITDDEAIDIATKITQEFKDSRKRIFDEKYEKIIKEVANEKNN